MPVFGAPLFFIGMIAVPALAGIYWLRNRFRRRTVSSLMLWVRHRQPKEGGRRMTRLQTPLLFFLELIALLLIVLAATSPMVLSRRASRPLVVVLDDSFSMRAGGGDSVRDRARAAVLREISGDSSYSVRFVVAGASPRVLGEPVTSSDAAGRMLESWTCSSALANLDKAVALASEIGGSGARILVVTDRSVPEGLSEDGRIQWWAFGLPMPNVAFVNAVRSTRDEKERCLFEIANLSDGPASRTVVVKTLDPELELQRARLDLAAGETRRLFVNLKEHAPAVTAKLDADDLALDDRVVLLPETRKTVAVRVRVRNAELSALVRRALDAVEGVDLDASPVELVFTDERTGGSSPETWSIRFVDDNDAVSYAGPFVIDHAHPLANGLSLEGLVWGGGKQPTLPGRPIVTAGNVPLVTDSARAGGAHDVRVLLIPKLSTFTESLDWPIFVWNAVDWRASVAPGLRRCNVRLGADADLTLERGVTKVAIAAPEGEPREVPVPDRVLSVRASEVGVWRIETDNATHVFSANALSTDESDLRACDSGRWGNWAKAAALRWDYRNIAWMLLLGALALMATHEALVARSTKGGR